MAIYLYTCYKIHILRATGAPKRAESLYAIHCKYTVRLQKYGAGTV